MNHGGRTSNEETVMNYYYWELVNHNTPRIRIGLEVTKPTWPQRHHTITMKDYKLVCWIIDEFPWERNKYGYVHEEERDRVERHLKRHLFKLYQI